MRRAVVLRPEPGHAETVARLAAAGLGVVSLPLFQVAPLAWTPPDPAAFDALLLTSANAARHGGAGLDWLRMLPVVAVGEATARAARDAGFMVAMTGEADASAAVRQATARGFVRLLHLAGRDRTGAWANVTPIPVYASEAVIADAAVLHELSGTVILLHSPRAAAMLVASDPIDRATIRLAAISPATAAAAGSGWRRVASAAAPTDAALVALAVAFATEPDD